MATSNNNNTAKVTVKTPAQIKAEKAAAAKAKRAAAEKAASAPKPTTNSATLEAATPAQLAESKLFLENLLAQEYGLNRAIDLLKANHTNLKPQYKTVLGAQVALNRSKIKALISFDAQLKGKDEATKLNPKQLISLINTYTKSDFALNTMGK